ncbi:LCP family protein [Halanaerobium hydrogeniformans]|uniref:Cell envelope-related transcriptional attenuator n=1 Tax=Halanaerobium hydrogeniformans TaxID=656519 RepID=E4RIQ8_HALHG|nr:LCP family protein [Halanaerobium hydrogeniformans]ADQ15128.1 cell envelope-related transcriptional attenuator [Halanaerobium hydrogeniformans]
MLEKLTDWKYISLIIFMLIIGISVAYIWNDELSQITDGPFEDNKVNILAVGYDSDINGGASRADTIILISIDVDTNEAGVIFLPRDTYINIEGKNFTKLNTSFARGGIDLTKETVEELLDINIDYYLASDFKGFENIIDRLGGIEIDVEKDLNYVDRAGDLYINISQGKQHLSGEEALKYVRYRDQSGDIGRIERQQKFIDAVIEKVVSPSTVTSLPGIFREINRSIDTDIPIRDISPFLSTAKDMDLNNIEIRTLPGEARYIAGISYWLADMEKSQVMIENLVRNKSYINNSNYKLKILNGQGGYGIASNTASLLRKYGFQIDRIGNADHFNYENSLIIYFNEDDESTAKKVAELLNAEKKFSEEDSGAKNLEIILGHDYELPH